LAGKIKFSKTWKRRGCQMTLGKKYCCGGFSVVVLRAVALCIVRKMHRNLRTLRRMS
jgi:hypothetical protein